MLAQDIMTSDVASARPDTTVKDIARQLLERRISAVPIVDADDRLVGIVSEGDLTRRAELGTEREPHSPWLRFFIDPDADASAYVKSQGKRASDVMTRSVITVDEDTPVSEIARILEEKAIKRVPVVRDGRIVGIVSRANLLHGLATSASVGEAEVSVDDRTVRARLLEELETHGDVSTRFINAIVSNGVVHLWGVVDTEAQKRAVEVAAERAAGVKTVRNHLGVVPVWVYSSE